MTTEALVRKTNSALAVAEGYEKGDTRGTEGIDSSDVRLSFIAIAQKTSKAIDPTETGKFIDGLKFMDMYNSETRDIYGTGPIQFIPLLLRKRANLLKDNGTLGEPVQWDDPRVTWEGARDAGRDKPEGQQIYDWAVLLVVDGNINPLPIVLSFRSTSFGAGKSLNGFVKVRKPAFAGLYNLSVVPDKNEKGSFGKFLVQPAGAPAAEHTSYAEMVYESIKGQKIVIEDEPEPGAEASTQSTQSAQPAKSNDNIPF